MGRGPAVGLLALALVLSLAVAGCLGGPSEDDLDVDGLPSEYDASQRNQDVGQQEEDSDTWQPDDGYPETDAQDPADENTTTDPADNKTDDPETEEDENGTHIGPPEAELHVRNSTGEATKTAMAVAPFDAVFQIDGKIAGDGIPYWSLRLSGSDEPIAEGNRLPAEVNHTIVAPGEHKVILFLSDGMTRDEEQVTLQLQRPAPPPTLHFNGTISGFWLPEQGYVGEMASHGFPLAVPVEKIQVNLTAQAPAFDLDFELVAPDGTVVDRRSAFNDPTGLAFDEQEAPIVVQDPKYTYQLGEWTLYVKPAFSAGGSYQATVSFS